MTGVYKVNTIHHEPQPTLYPTQEAKEAISYSNTEEKY